MAECLWGGWRGAWFSGNHNVNALPQAQRVKEPLPPLLLFLHWLRILFTF